MHLTRGPAAFSLGSLARGTWRRSADSMAICWTRRLVAGLAGLIAAIIVVAIVLLARVPHAVISITL